MRTALTFVVLAVSSVIGCTSLGLQPVAIPPNLRDALECQGEVFTPMLPPPGIVTGEAVVEKMRASGFPPFAPPNSRAATPVYGVITDEKVGMCKRGSFVQSGHQLAVWLVVWPDVSGSDGLGQAWAIVGPRTGSLIAGDGPPGR
jgi:hypothetical protein